MNKTAQDLTVEIQSIRKTKTEEIKKKLGRDYGRKYRGKPHKQIQGIEEKTTAIKDIREEKHTLIKENIKPEIILIQNIQEIWKTMKRANLRKIKPRKGKKKY